MVDFEGADNPGFGVDPGPGNKAADTPGGGKMNDNWWKAFAVAIVFIVIFAWLGILTSRSQCCTAAAGGGSAGGVNPQTFEAVRAEVAANNYWHREQLYDGGGDSQSGWPAAIAEEVDRICTAIEELHNRVDELETPNGNTPELCPDPAPKYPPPPPPPFP